MKNEDLKQQIVDLLANARLAWCPHSVADYLIANNITKQIKENR